MASKNRLKYFFDLENRARNKLIKRYDKPLSYHDVKMINDILYNEKTHYVEAFKEYLIYEDYNEFLKRFYKSSELAIKLPKILIFYEKYSKIYANYTVIPESKYMYKNIKRKQKMIDQMQNNDINNTDNEEEEEENEDISNTVFSSKVMNSIYNRTLSSLNRSDNGGNSEQSINNFIGKINDIETKANYINLNTNTDNKNTKKFQKKIILPIKTNKNSLTNNNNNISNKPNSKSRIQINKNEKFLNNNRTNNNNNNLKGKNLDIQITYSKKSFQNDLSNNNNNNNKSNNNNSNNIQNANYYSGNVNINSINQKKNNNNIYINDYKSKNNNYSNSNSILNNNNNSVGNNTNNSNTFHNHQNSLNLNNFSKQKLRENIINEYNMKENMSDNNINNNVNNYFSNESNIINNLKNNHKSKLSLGETLLKQEKIVLSTNTSVSPTMLRENLFSSANTKNNIFVNKKRLLLKEKLIEKGYLNPENNSNINSNDDNIAKKIKPNLLMEYNSVKRKEKVLENKQQKNLNKSNKKKYMKKIKDVQSININKEPDNYVYSEVPANIIQKKPESHRNYYHNKVLSNNNMRSKMMSNTNKGFKITVGVKPEYLPPNYKKAITTHCSPNSSSSNFYYNSQHNKNNIRKNAEKNIKKTLEENNKKKVVNYNIINNIQDNSTQINIYTGSDLYKSLHFHNNSVFNSPNSNFGIGSFSRSPIGRGIGDGVKNKNNIQKSNYFKSTIKGKEKNKYNLNLKKIIHKRILENDREKGLISERLMTHNKLLEKLEKYFLKNNNESNINNKNIKINNYNSNNNKNTNKNNYNRNNILYNNFTKNANTNTNSEQRKLITKIISKNFNHSNDNKLLKNKTNNNTPFKKNYNKFLNENKQNMCLSPQNNEQFRKVTKPIKKQKINYNSLMNNLNDANNFGFDNANKFLINSDRNQNYKIVFK